MLSNLLKLVNLTALAASVVWLLTEPSWEPLAATLALLGSLLGQLFIPREGWRLEADRALFHDLYTLLPSKQVRFLADYDFAAAFRFEWVEPLFTIAQVWTDREHGFHDTHLEMRKSKLLASISLSTAALAHYTFPEKPNVHRLPRELQRDNPAEYRRLAATINDSLSQVEIDHIDLVASAIKRLRIPSPAIERIPPLPVQNSTEPRVPSQPETIENSMQHKAARQPLRWRPFVEVAGVIAAISTCLLALVVALFGDSLCTQSSQPPSLTPFIQLVCPVPPPAEPTVTPTAPVTSPTPIAHASIFTPANGSSVPELVPVTGQVADIPPDQLAFAVIRSTAFGKLYFPQGPISPDEDGAWAIQAIYKSEGYSYETFVVLATTPEAIAVLSEPFSRTSGLAQLPPGAYVLSDIVVVTRR